MVCLCEYEREKKEEEEKEEDEEKKTGTGMGTGTRKRDHHQPGSSSEHPLTPKFHVPGHIEFLKVDENHT